MQTKQLIEALREAESLEQRKALLSSLTKEEEQALFSEAYFEYGAKLNISLYDMYISKFRGFYTPYDVAYHIVRSFNLSRVLELGCASGRFVKALRKLRVEAYGVDVSSYALSKSDADIRKYLLNINIDTEELPFHEDYFDMAVAIDTLEHLVNINHILNELRRLRIHFIFLTVPKPNSPDAFKDVTHLNIWNRDKWVKAFSIRGFSYTPFQINYHEMLKAHVDLLTIHLDFGSGVKEMLIKLLRKYPWGASVLYSYLLMRRRLCKALQTLKNSDYVFLFKKEP